MTKAEVSRAQKLRDKGATYSQIAEKLGVSDSTVRRWLNKPCSGHGKKHPHQVTMAKLNRDIARVEEAEAEVFEALVPEKRSKIAKWWRDFRKAFLTFDAEEPNLG